MLLETIKATLIASALSIVLIIIFAFLLKASIISSGGIPLGNSIIKVISAAAAALLAVRKCQKKLWLYGGMAGLAHALMAFLVFAILADSFTFSLALLGDLCIGALAGMLAAITRQIFRK